MKTKLLAATGAVVASTGLMLAGCQTAAPSAAPTAPGAVSGAPTQSAAAEGRGPITFVQGKDNNGVMQPLVDAWNAQHPDQKVTFKEQTDQADQQHDDLVQHFQAKSADYDVVIVDVIWTAEFAAQGWVQELSGDYAVTTDGMLPATVNAGTYNGKLYTAPFVTDGGILYYRSDLVKTPPKTWDELQKDCSIAKSHGMACYAGQFAKYEGLVCNFAEAVNTDGGTIVGADGATPTLDTAQAKAGLQRLVDGFKDGTIDPKAITYQEEQGRQAFESGKLLFLRNWPYVYSLASTDKDSKVIGKFAVAPLPGVTADKGGASTLGGHNLAISAFSKNKATAADFIRYLQSPETEKTMLQKASNAPALASLYDDPTLQQQFPYLPALKGSLSAAVPRPVSPFYPKISQAIQDNAYPALKGEKTVDQALADMQAAIQTAGQGG